MRVRVGLCVAGLCASVLLRGDARLAVRRGSDLMHAPPATVLWAWEEPEDVRALDPQRLGVAFLAERDFLGSGVQVSPRRQRVLVPKGAYVIAVARLEAMPDFSDSTLLRKETAAALLHLASLPNVSGVQVDFDATVSQREFYADVLRQVRAGLQPGAGLTMTALVSWCSIPAGWLARLPVDAAVPMEFRLGKHAGRWEVREPLCLGSAGISTDEPQTAPALPAGTRVYLFSPRPWTAEQLAVLNRDGVPWNARGGQ